MDGPLLVAGIFLAASVVSILSWRPLTRAVSWLFRRNVGEPVSTWADRMVTTVVTRELKTRNGGNSIADIREQLNRLEANAVMNGERLGEVGRVARETSDKLEHHLERVAESGILKQGIARRVAGAAKQ